VLPGGMMHLVFRLTEHPLRIAASRDERGELVASSLVGGARSRYYVRETSAPSCSVGALLHPGVAELLFGATADELAERHTSLEDLWGAPARQARDRILDAATLDGRLAALESILAARLPRVRSMHPAVAAVIDEMRTMPSIAASVQRSGVSHRHFIANFRRSVGLTPKTYLRVLRFQHALQALRGGAGLAAAAVDAGYSDQSHFNRDFLELAGVTPSTYLRLSPRETNHVAFPA
jgi:AraC-like DNA-binding protein